MTEIEERIRKEKERLTRRKEQFREEIDKAKKRIRALQGEERKKQRKDQRSRDLIFGRIVRRNAGILLTGDMHSILDEYVTEDHERTLFGLHALKPEPETPVQKTAGTAVIRIEEDQVMVRTPEKVPDFAAGVKAFGGKWSGSSQEWRAPARHVDAVTELARKCYGKVEIQPDG